MGTLKKILGIVALITERKNFDRFLNKVKIVAADPGKVVAELKVEEDHQNAGGTLHGGLTASLVDSLTTLALLSRENGQPGVSVDLHVSYMSSAKVGDLVTITAEAIKVGKTMAFTTAIFKLQNGTIVAKGNHTKYLGNPKI